MESRNSPRVTIVALAAFLFSVTFVPTFAQSWTIQDRLDLDSLGVASYMAIDSPDTTHCMALGFASSLMFVRRTTDGGTTWTTVLERYYQEPKLYDIACPTTRLAIVVGETHYVGRDTGTTILRSTDGGTSWNHAWCDSCAGPSGRSLGVRHIAMYDSLHGMASGGLNLLIRTSDGGATWRRLKDPTNLEYQFDDIASCGSTSYALLARIAGKEFRVYRTDDFGDHWFFAPAADSIYGITFADSLHGWGVGFGRNTENIVTSDDIVTRTTDGGRSWQVVFKKVTDNHRSFGVTNVDFADSDNGIAVGQEGKNLRTLDGNTWQAGPNLDSLAKVGNLTCITYPHPDKAWIASSNGQILAFSSRVAAVPAMSKATEFSIVLTAFPNPSSESTPIRFTVRTGARISPCFTLTNILGEETAIILDGTMALEPGTHELSLKELIPSGMYFARLVSCGASTVVPIVVNR
jgi:photosystem II stability/assembly factor-like uncharacterized protein